MRVDIRLHSALPGRAGCLGRPEDTQAPSGEGRSFMGWQANEVWFDTDVRWFREQPRKPFGRSQWTCRRLPRARSVHLSPPRSRPGSRLRGSGGRQRRPHAGAASPRVRCLRPRWCSGRPRCSRSRRSGHDDGEHAGPLQEDPPSLTFRFGLEGSGLLEAPLPPRQSSPESCGDSASVGVRRVAPRQVGRPSLFRASRRRHPASPRRA